MSQSGGSIFTGDHESGQSSLSTKPYLIQAIYRWAIDNAFTPQILVDAEAEQAVLPEQYIRDGQILLNIHPNAIQSLELGMDYLTFSARFSGKSHEVIVPISAILAIYAKENAQGMIFQSDGSGISPPPPPDTTPPDKAVAKKPRSSVKNKAKGKHAAHLKLVK